MTRFYAVSSGRVPGVYRTWAEASAQTNGFRGSVHCSFTNLSDAVEFSGIPLQQQPGWVRTALGVPNPAVAQPTSAAVGPPPSQTPTPASALLPSGLQASIVTSSPPHDPTGSLAEALHSVSIHSPAAPAPIIGSKGISSSPNTFSCRSGASEITSNRSTGNQQAPALTSFFARAAAGVSSTSGPRDPRHSTPISSPNTSPIHSPSHSAHHIGTQRNIDSRSSRNHSGCIEDSILSGVFHSPAPDANTSSEDTINDTSSNDSTSSGDDWLDPMEPMAGGLYGMPDSRPNRYQITLRTASLHASHYAPILTSLLGQHAVNYLFLHYYSAGSTVVVANAYAEHRSSARRFVEHLL
ncbi:hypothetical protein FS837_010884 [Tulasnella sp. UAMH 9824]|nr:hypothetical protein FS837_010884 [Tulasnella sp. UAMH 9824]